MKNTLNILTLILAFIFISCGGNDKKEDVSYGKKAPVKEEIKQKASERVELGNKGVGPVTSLDLALVVDQDMAAHGKEIYGKMCTACHKAEKKFIGPSPKGILERRSPEWIMNMILAPDKMVKEDPLAKDLLIEFNGSPMANQNLTKEEARAVLEYFRTL
ncbi:MAG: cytochrome c [Winogradskyella sp.]|uniref:c-type cytochrome n=1 Tax=Winogradskyella sp. TaxID=1883156 RepID=UPI0017A5ACA4|nr:cytochrome c [Winogradskyella sp.]MBT8245700.1 cytochrome c [Winogradskyella sp.]NNK21756.1 cytochrome c [Winogradskyella sp.]